MQFLSFYILLFITLVAGINAVIKHEWRNYWLLLCNLIFIAFFSWQAAILAAVLAGCNFVMASQASNRRWIFGLAISLNIVFLILANYIIAYGNLLSVNFESIDFTVHPALISLGLSFYTLQHISYLIDCKVGKQKVENNGIRFLLVATFFPKFLCGPLVKYNDLSAQLECNDQAPSLYLSGLNRLLWGVFKKMVIADRLAPAVHSVFDFGDTYSGITIWSAAIIFTIQLYFDFSGYTDMAIGTAKMLGINLPENFNLPFRASSVSEFWRRWHITLIRFFTEYVFNPISFRLRKHRLWSSVAGIICTFFLSGLWHGIGLAFLLWSLCHMFYLLLELFVKRFRGAPNLLFQGMGYVYTLVAVSWSNIFFRSTNQETIKRNWDALTGQFFPHDLTTGLLAPLAVGGHQINFFNFWISVCLALIVLIFEKRLNFLSQKNRFSALYTLSLLVLIFVFGVFASGEQFIYVQF